MRDKESVNAEFDEQGRVVTTVAELERVEAAWALAIGRFIVVFASLEYWTYQFIRTFGTDEQRTAVNGQRLWRRLQTMELVLERLRLIEATQSRVDSAIAHFRGLTPTRNLLAHNAPMVHVYTENADGTGRMEIMHELRSAIDPTAGTTIEKLESDVTMAKRLEEELALLYGEVRQPVHHRA